MYVNQSFKIKHKYTHTFKHHGLVHSSKRVPTHTLPNLTLELTNKNANNGCLSMVKSHKGPFYYFPSSLKRSRVPSCVCVCVIQLTSFPIITNQSHMQRPVGASDGCRQAALPPWLREPLLRALSPALVAWEAGPLARHEFH